MVDLGEWDVLVSDTADDLAEVYADGIVAGADLADFDVSTDCRRLDDQAADRHHGEAA